MKRRPLQDKAFKALKEAVKGVIEEHKRSGRPLSVWRNGKVMKISARQALREWKRKEIEESYFVDPIEMAQIKSDKGLMERLKAGHRDAKKMKRKVQKEL